MEARPHPVNDDKDKETIVYRLGCNVMFLAERNFARKHKKKKEEPKKEVNTHAWYYATITLNQLVLNAADREAALALIVLYFETFKEILGEGRAEQGKLPGTAGRYKKGKGKHGKKETRGATGFAEVEDAHSRLVSAILTSVNRVLPLLVQHIAAALALGSTTDRFYRTLYASLHDPRLAASSKQAMYLNLLFKSLKADPNTDYQAAEGVGRRSLLLAGCICLEMRLRKLARAGASPLWELIPLTVHYHPAITFNARQLLAAQPLTASADLAQNTLGHFLDRFVYKNLKNAGAQPKGDSAMQPAANPGGADGTVVRLLKGEVQQGAPVNKERFWRKKREDVLVDEMFFHTYFAKKNEKGLAKSAKVDKRRDHEPEEVESAAEEDDEDGDDSGEDGGEDGGDSATATTIATTCPLISKRPWARRVRLMTIPVPRRLIDFDGSGADDEEEEWGGVDAGKKRKRASENKEKNEKRKKLRSLPTFASYKDYAKLIDDGPEDDI
ncbi:hypothetical protein FIBSPDRAFT_898186 [Athelia psychrophila]|uniref:CCAAT-binding factor domain-containing protein n=1 Tax=Athelia psychrophila TaxID=1759441 RepID=A0A166B9T5_9AGAM|nr:hypothetical protein FIBSPDRAFT_898186 [Fibularhizoctonia sp. CBS 109695]